MIRTVIALLLFCSSAFAEGASTSFVAFPADCNANPPMVFGGKLFSEMDRCAGIEARRFLYKSQMAKDAATVGVTDLVFHKAARVKDLLTVRAVVTKAGTRSITMYVTITREVKGSDYPELIVSGVFTYVAFDLKTEKAIPHGLKDK